MSDLRQAASVILVRPREAAGSPLEVLLLRRHKAAGFMANAYVFPGGIAEPNESDLRQTAARELFEEAGVLIADRALPMDTLRGWRERAAAGEDLIGLLDAAGVKLALEQLHYFAHWVTPSIEKRRYSARFFIAALPPGQTPSFDAKETVDEAWVTPEEALGRAGELRLPPPQVRTFFDMLGPAATGLAALIAAAVERERDPQPILPRMCQLENGFALLLPWDPDYASSGTGDKVEMRADHPLAIGPSRFVLEESTWKNVYAPGSGPTA